MAVKNHATASLNPNAQYRSKVTLKEVLSSTMVADPLRLLDCSPVTDGAAAVVLASVETARRLKPGQPLVKVTGSGVATDTISLAQRAELAELTAVRPAAASGPTPWPAARRPTSRWSRSTTASPSPRSWSPRRSGCSRPARAGPAVQQGLTAIGGKVPVNPSGGLKSKGHPVGATGVAQVVEIVSQLRGEAGARQVAGARVGLAQNMGGSGGSSVVHILEVV